MTLLAVPNLSEGRDIDRVKGFVETVESEGVRVLDVHSDASHNRSVLTLTGSLDTLIAACTALAAAAGQIDLTAHQGAHPRLGGLDVCPFVPHGSGMDEAVRAAAATAERIGQEVGLPVYLYGHAATRAAARELPDLRRGGLGALSRKAIGDMPPDAGPRAIDMHRGVVCVGARGPLIAFNVWLDAELKSAQVIAHQLRSPKVRALGMALEDGTTQVSMNLIDPASVGIVEVFETVGANCADLDIRIIATEIVGLLERRFLPPRDATATRLLLEPGHCLEERLERLG
jgi:glutamate formiminotransferase